MVIFISKNISSFYKFTNVLIFIQDLMIDITNNNVLKKLDNISDLIQEINLEHQDEFRNISEGFAILEYKMNNYLDEILQKDQKVFTIIYF